MHDDVARAQSGTVGSRLRRYLGLRLTESGAEVLEHAVRGAEISETVENIVSNRLSDVVGTLRLSAPPSISDTLLTPLVTAFQASYPNVLVQIRCALRGTDGPLSTNHCSIAAGLVGGPDAA